MYSKEVSKVVSRLPATVVYILMYIASVPYTLIMYGVGFGITNLLD